MKRGDPQFIICFKFIKKLWDGDRKLLCLPFQFMIASYLMNEYRKYFPVFQENYQSLSLEPLKKFSVIWKDDFICLEIWVEHSDIVKIII